MPTKRPLLFNANDIGFADPSATRRRLAFAFGADAVATERFNNSIVRPDDDADHTPRAILAYIDRVLNIVDPVHATVAPSGITTTPIPRRTTPVTTLTPTPDERFTGRSSRNHGFDIGHFIETVLVTFDDTPTRPPLHLDGYADALIDREITALRRAWDLYHDAPDATPHDILPDSLEYVIPDADDRRDGRDHFTRLLRTHRVLISDDVPNGYLARLTIPTGTTTQRAWARAIRQHLVRLLELGLTFDDIDARVNADD